MADMDISERRLPQDGHLTLPRRGQDYDLRVSSLPSIEGEKIVIRVLSKNTDRWSLDKIVTSPQDNRKFRSIVENPYGMLLLTGPTGCGKTTTLYGLLQLLNSPEKNVVTVEDPVEYHLDGITQVQVNPTAGRTFAKALRSILRQDPDIILIGEIRDVETAEIAVSSALTGHFVLSTLHTNDAASAISRLTNLGVPSYLAASALLATAAQRLIRVSCPKCRQLYEPSEDELRYLRRGFSAHDAEKKVASENDEPMKLYRGTGCENCGNTGHYGRKSVYEILDVSREIQRMIAVKSSDQEIRQQAVKEGMKTLYESAVNEILNGVTTPEELTRIIDVEAN
jgi:type II secretory ATPase GspE/PulE/Tfp pilus assembly ATPase PilB-like protein